MTLRFHNSLTKQEEDFRPLDPEGRRVTFYSCGPTVYDYAHIGNFRSFLNADVMRRTFELLGYEVRHVMNITDVGHMTDDDVADGGAKTRWRSRLGACSRQRSPASCRRMRRASIRTIPMPSPTSTPHAFLEDARTLGLKVALEVEDDPSLMPRPTRYIPQMIDMIETLIEPITPTWPAMAWSTSTSSPSPTTASSRATRPTASAPARAVASIRRHRRSRNTRPTSCSGSPTRATS